MDQFNKLDRHRRLLQQIIRQHAAMKPGDRQLDSLAICDPTNDNFLLDVKAYGLPHSTLIHNYVRNN